MRPGRVFFALLLQAVVLAPCLKGQARPAATGPGSFITAGATISGYHFPYGDQRIGGFTIFADANLTHNIGVEAEYRNMSWQAQEHTRFVNYLVGPRYALRYGSWYPYGKVLVGRGDFRFPYSYANGSYFTIAPGAGLDLRVLHGRAFIRVVDFEYQDWHDFSFGPAHPYGLSAGVSIRVF